MTQSENIKSRKPFIWDKEPVPVSLSLLKIYDIELLVVPVYNKLW
ncbi:hypothetical protein SAMN04515679_3303 [Pelosinus fermentans]|nr:hypothetical protein FR7_03170 [Pelosinus fermentans DSM 17108]SDR23984.1 hypothetical protein SAMN04515679_3303 [Pelosinus fermentans]